MGFSATPDLERIHASLFLVLSLVAVTGNSLMITATSVGHSLCSPMFDFLEGLSFVDLCYVSVTVPRSIYNSFCRAMTFPSGNTRCSVLLSLSVALPSSPCSRRCPTISMASPLHCATKSSWISAHASMESWVCRQRVHFWSHAHSWYFLHALLWFPCHSPVLL